MPVIIQYLIRSFTISLRDAPGKNRRQEDINHDFSRALAAEQGSFISRVNCKDLFHDSVRPGYRQ